MKNNIIHNGAKNWFNTQVLLPLCDKTDVRALRSFALTMSIAFPAVFMALLPYIFDGSIPYWPAVISVVLMSLYVLLPKALYYPYLCWMYFASVIGFLNTRLILALAYYVLIVPIGLFMQWRKGLQYKTESNQTSAWVKRSHSPQKNNLKEPF